VIVGELEREMERILERTTRLIASDIARACSRHLLTGLAIAAAQSAAEEEPTALEQAMAVTAELLGER